MYIDYFLNDATFINGFGQVMDSFLLNLHNLILKTNRTILVLIILFVNGLAQISILGQEKATLTKVWKTEFAETIEYEIFSDNKNTLFVTLQNGKFLAIDAFTGQIIWTDELGGKVSAQPIYKDEKIFILLKTSDKNLLKSISAETGITIWQTKLDASDNVKLYISNNEIVVDNNKIDIKSGKISDQKFVKELELENKENYLIKGKQVNFPVKIIGSIKLQSIFENKNIILSDSIGNLINYDLIASKIIWIKRLGGEIIKSKISNNNIIVSSADNFIYSIKINSGKIQFKSRFENKPIGGVLILDKNYFITTIYADDNFYLVDNIKGKIIEKIKICELCFTRTNAKLIAQSILIQTDNSIIAYKK